MGCVKNITFNKFPKQGKNLNRDVKEPFKTIIKLNDDRVVLAEECQYSWI